MIHEHRRSLLLALTIPLLLAVAPVAAADTSWTVEDHLLPEQAGAHDFVPSSLDVHGTTLAMGFVHDDHAGEFSGSVAIFERANGSWTQTHRITASDADEGDEFGWSVDIDGDTLAVGARGDEAPGGNENTSWAGSVYVLNLRDGAWAEEAKLRSGDPGPSEEFGTSVALDGDRLLVGEDHDDDRSGAAWVFHQASNGSWIQEIRLTSSDGASWDLFGHEVALEGSRAVVAAPWHDAAGNDTGAVYTFRPVNGSWTEESKLVPSDANPEDGFGNALALDDGTLVVGAPHGDEPSEGVGRAYIYVNTSHDWELESSIAGEKGDHVGRSVDVHGSTVLLGTEAGVALQYVRDASGAWHREGVLGSPDAASTFGQPLRIRSGVAFLGDAFRDHVGPNSGVTYVYLPDQANGTDADQDGLSDEEEATWGTDPHDRDTDGDGLEDGAEAHTHGTDPLDPDTDGDLHEDGEEVEAGSDPTNPTSVPTPTGSVTVTNHTRGEELPTPDGVTASNITGSEGTPAEAPRVEPAASLGLPVIVVAPLLLRRFRTR